MDRPGQRVGVRLAFHDDHALAVCPEQEERPGCPTSAGSPERLRSGATGPDLAAVTRRAPGTDRLEITVDAEGAAYWRQGRDCTYDVSAILRKLGVRTRGEASA
jgi:hypothetical protein